MTRRLIFWLLFAGLLALLGYGFWSARLLAQSVWTPAGVQRLAWFAAIYGAWALLAVVAFPRRFAQATLLGALACVIAAAGVRAPAAVLFFLLSSWALGRLAGLEGWLGLMVGLSLHAWIIGLAVHLPVNYAPSYAAWFALPLIFACRRLWAGRARVAEWFRRREGGRKQVWPAALLGLILLAHLLVALGPEVSADGLAVHLAVPMSIEAHHRMVFDVRHTAWAAMPMGGDWCFTAAYLLGGEAAARLLNFGLLLAVVALLGASLEHVAPSGVRLFSAALLASSPLVQLVTGSLFTENFLAATLGGAFLALVRYRESADRRYACAAAVLLGTGLNAKFGALAYALAVGALLALELRRRRALRLWPVLAALLAVFAAPPYLKAYFQTGNPVFPFLNTVFRSPYFDTQTDLVDYRFRRPLTATSLYDLTFHTSRHLEAQNGALGFHYLLLLPLAVAMLRRRSSYAEWAALGVSLPFSLLTFATQSNARYLYPALPLFMILAAGLLAAARDESRVRYRGLLAAALTLFFLNVWFLPASGWYHKEFFVNRLLDPAAWDGYLDYHAPARKLVAYLNQRHPGEPVFFVQNSQIAGLRGRAYTETWHHDAFRRRLRTAASPSDCLRLMQELGIRRFVAPGEVRHIRTPAVRSLLAVFTRPETQSAGWQVASLSESPSLPAAPPPVPPGSYDDMDLSIDYWGRWSGGGDFPKAAGGSVTFSNRRGDRFRLTFQGSEVTWFHTKAFNRGRAEVLLDGASKGVVDLYSQATIWQARRSFGGLGRGAHTFEVRVLGEKHPAAADCFVDVDLLLVR